MIGELGAPRGCPTCPSCPAAGPAPTSPGAGRPCSSRCRSTCSPAAGGSSTGRDATSSGPGRSCTPTSTRSPRRRTAGPVRSRCRPAGRGRSPPPCRCTRGERVVTDPGAVRDLVDSLAEGLAQHVGDVRRLVPGAEVVVQLDEPSLPAVLRGGLPTVSGFGKLSAVEAVVVEAALDPRGRAAAGRRRRHRGGALLRAGRARRAAAGRGRRRRRPRHLPARAARLGVGGRRGRGGHPAVGRRWCPRPASCPPTTELVDRLHRPWRDVGLGADLLADVVVTPACGLAGCTPRQARALTARTVELARRARRGRPRLTTRSRGARPLSHGCGRM